MAADEPKSRWELYPHRLVTLHEDLDGYGSWTCACGVGAGGYRWAHDSRGIKLCMSNEWGEHVRDTEAVPGDGRPDLP